MPVYALVETKHIRWVSQLRCLNGIKRGFTESETTFSGFTRLTSTRYWIPYLVEDVLDLIEHQINASQGLFSARFINWGEWLQRTRPATPFLTTLPLPVLEAEYIIPAIEMSRAEGPEPAS